MSIDARGLRSLGGVLISFLCTVGAASALEPEQEPVVLVATDRPVGPGYRETVLFAAPLPSGYHIGFILNRPTPAKLETLFPEHAPSRKVVDPVYVGGPVLPEALFAVARRTPDGGQTIPLMPGLVLAQDSATVDRVIETMPNDARYFAGFVLWLPGELDDEVRGGAWEVRPADPSAVFNADPERLWRDLHTGSGGKGLRVSVPFVDLALARFNSLGALSGDSGADAPTTGTRQR